MKREIKIQRLFFIFGPVLLILSCSNPTIVQTGRLSIRLIIHEMDGHHQDVKDEKSTGDNPENGSKNTTTAQEGMDIISSLAKPSLRTTALALTIYEPDGDIILSQRLEQREDSCFGGLINVLAGCGRRIEVLAYYNETTIAEAEELDVDIFPGQVTHLEMRMSFVRGIERNLTLVTTDSIHVSYYDSLAHPIIIKVTDNYGNGIPNVNVYFHLISGDVFFANQLDSAVAITDVNGNATVSIYYGSPGESRIQVSAYDRSGDALLDSPIKIIATKEAIPIAQIFDIDPFICIPGQSITITGANFQYSPILVRFVSTGAYSDSVVVLSDSLLVARVPDGVMTGAAQVRNRYGSSDTSSELRIAERTTRVLVDGEPNDIAITSSGDLVFVLQTTYSVIHIIDGNKDAVIRPYYPHSTPSVIDVARMRTFEEQLIYIASNSGCVITMNPNTDSVLTHFCNENFASSALADLLMLPDGETGFISVGSAIYKIGKSFDRYKVARAYLTQGLPGKMSCNRGGDIIAVTDIKRGSILVFNRDFGSEKIIQTCDSPSAVALTSDANYAWVTCRNNNTVTLVNVVKERIEVRIKVANYPEAVVLSRDERLAIVANRDSNSISFIDTEKRKMLFSINVHYYPIALAVHPKEDKVYVVNLEGRTVDVIRF